MSKILKSSTASVQRNGVIEAKRYAIERTKHVPNWMSDVVRRDYEQTFLAGFEYGSNNKNNLSDSRSHREGI